VSDSILQIKNLTVEFSTRRGALKAVDNLSFSIASGEVLGIVGESGSGKSVTSLAIMGLLPNNSKVTAEKINFNGNNLLNLSETDKQKLRGGDMAMIFQDPMTSLNPSYTVGFQIVEALKIHQGGSKKHLHDRAVELLSHVGIPDPQVRIKSYPHQLSGGMSQRVMIAMAIACKPKLLILDEPTTALDVTIQNQILRLLFELKKETNMAMLLITHDIAVVAENSDRILVMYAGQCVEYGNTGEVIEEPTHPYSEGLLASLPSNYEGGAFLEELPTIKGVVPDLSNRPEGCQLNPRCPYVEPRCLQAEPKTVRSSNRLSKCIKPLGNVF